jgi:uncharacterized phage-like protein YoqJ
MTITGHRPDKIGGYKNISSHKKIRRHIRDFLQQAPDGELVVVSGGNLGIEQFAIEVALYLDLPVVLAMPFENYNERWPAQTRRKHDELLKKCWKSFYVCDPGYAPWKLEESKKWLVDNSDILTAYWNGSIGNTSNYVEYALKKKKHINYFNSDEIIL